MQSLVTLRAREAEVAREWTWLVQAIHKVSEVHAGRPSTIAIRLLHEQAMAVGQLRNTLWQHVVEAEAHDAARSS